MASHSLTPLQKVHIHRPGIPFQDPLMLQTILVRLRTSKTVLSNMVCLAAGDYLNLSEINNSIL